MKLRLHSTAHAVKWIVLACMGGALLSGCDDDDEAPVNILPAGITQLGVTSYPAVATGAGDTAATQDLLTAGLGRTGLGAAAAPAYANPLAPTALELRRNAVYGNYRALLDYTANGGYGTLYGPNVDIAGVATNGQGLIPGRESIATLDDGVQPKARSLFKASSDRAAVSAPVTRPFAARPVQRAVARAVMPAMSMKLKVVSSVIAAPVASAAQGWYRLP